MKFFDYKFVIILGLSMVVYFLYREIELLGKRVNTLENKTSSNMNELELELPPPPKPSDKTTDIVIPLSINKNNISLEKSRNDIIQLDTLNGTVEEYSNEVIYSNDMIQSNTIEHDTIMVDSIVNMVNNSDEDNSDNSDEDNSDEEISDMNNSCTDEVNNNEVSNPIINIVNNDNSNIVNDDNSNIVNNDNNDEVINKDTLLKHKLNELQTMAKENNISLNITGTSKKKTKLQLAQELSNKKNI